MSATPIKTYAAGDITVTGTTLRVYTQNGYVWMIGDRKAYTRDNLGSESLRKIMGEEVILTMADLYNLLVDAKIIKKELDI